MSASTPSLDALRGSLLELINACPVHNCNPADCPLFGLRMMNRSQRRHWFASLSKADLEYLAAYHYTCMNIGLSAPKGATGPAEEEGSRPPKGWPSCGPKRLDRL